MSKSGKSRLPNWLRAARNPDFRKVWVLSTLPQFGYWFCSIAFQWLVAQETGNDPIVLGVLYFAMLLPILLFSLPAGVLADRLDRRVILGITQLATVIIGIFTALLLWRSEPDLWVVLSCGFAVGTAHSFATPASAALVANSVPASDLQSAIPLQAMGMNVARMLGPALAGAIIFLGGTAQSLLLYAAMGALGLLVLSRVPLLQPRTVAKQTTSVLQQTREGFRHAGQHPPAALALAIVGVCSIFGASYLAQLPVLAANSSNSASAFMLLTSAGGLGSLIGVFLVATRGSGRPSVTSPGLMLLIMGIAVALLGHGPPLVFEMILIGVAGGLQFGIMTTCNRVIQQVVKDSYRGRVMSLYAITWGGFLPLGGLWLGLLIGLTGLTFAFTINGIVAMGFALWVLRPGTHRTGKASFEF